MLNSATEELKWRFREDLHLEPPPSQSGVQDFYTSEANENGAPCRCCPGAVCLEGRGARCYTNDAKLVAGLGIAPRSSALQAAALTDSAIQRWSLRAVSRRGLPVIDRLLCF